MAKTDVKAQIHEWVSVGLKSLAFCVFSMFTFFVNQLNTSITSLTTQLKSMEVHQIDTDKRVSAIEVSRDLKMVQYEKLINDVDSMKLRLTELSMRLQAISDSLVKKQNTLR